VSRITPGTVIVGIFAVLFGLVGAYGVRKYLQTEKPTPPPVAGPQAELVPLASMDIEPGEKIVTGHIAALRLMPEEIQKRWKEGQLPKQYMTDPNQIVGRILKSPLKQGDAFQTELFYPDGTGPKVAEKLTPGLRAVTIPVEGTGALGGFDGPGSYVDVVFRARPDDKAGIPETTVTLLEGVQVLAMEEADRRAPPGSNLENRVTLAVTAAQANALKIAEGRGSFSLTIRNAEDVEVAAATIPQTLDRLLNLPSQNRHVTAIYRGGDAETVAFAGAVTTPQPALALPVAGVLQMRAAERATSVRKDSKNNDQKEDEEGLDEEEADVEQMDMEQTDEQDTEADTDKASAPAIQPNPSNEPKPATQAADSESAGPESLQTVTTQIPVSVLLDKKAGAAANPPSDSAAVKPAEPTGADTSNLATTRRVRPRKLLSDIGRDQ